MQNRYSLRFDSGERQGESVPITGRGFLVGRKPGSSLQIVDGSVSGRHAELEVHDDHVLIRDLGSTNGTRIGPDRVLEEKLYHGAEVFFGNVQLTFQDAEFSGSAPAPSGAAPEVDEAPLSGVSAEKLAAAKGRRSILPIALLLVLVGLAVGVWSFLQKSGGTVRKIRPVEAVAGNKLGSDSFEEESLLWSAHEASTADFVRNSSAAYSGEEGLRAVVSEGEWALQRSEDVSVNSPGQVTIRAALDAVDGASGRVGVQFLRAANEDGEVSSEGSLFAWSKSRKGTEGFDSIEFTVPVPEGFANARAVLLATGDGTVDADDVSLVTGSGSSAPDARIGEFELRLLGEEGSTGVLHKVNRFLVSNLRAFEGAPSGAAIRAGVPITASPGGESALKLQFSGKRLSFAIEPDAIENGIATIGDGGYQVHSAGFERANATSLLIGIRKDLVRLRFPTPVTLTARQTGARLELTVENSNGEAVLQLDFREERAEAGNLAYQARKEAKDGHAGACMTTWTKLLDDYPYESALVQEAEEVRGQLTRDGLNEVRAVREELERGSFFRLVEIYWQCRAEAEAVAERYAGTEVAEAARAVIAEVDAEVAGLERDLQSYERSRLEGIKTALIASEATTLAAEVDRYLKENFAEEN